MVVKNTHTPAAAAMQACVTHSTCVADFVLYTSAPDRGGRKICRWPWCMCAQAKHFPHALFIDQPLSPWMSWPRWKRLHRAAWIKILIVDSAFVVGFICHFGHRYTSKLSFLLWFYSPSLLTDAGLNDSECNRYVFVFVSCGRLWRCQWWGGSVWEFLMFNLLL